VVGVEDHKFSPGAGSHACDPMSSLYLNRDVVRENKILLPDFN